MNFSLFLGAIIKFLSGVILTALLLFIPAGTIYWMNAWIFMGILFIPMFIAGIVMMIFDPDLLRSRLEGREKEGEQRKVVAMSGLMFIAGFIICGLGHRFNWYQLPVWAVITFSVIFAISYIMLGEVMRENRWLSRTIGVQEGQKVVSTGVYSVVRHPMYSATLVLFLCMPLVLGSVYAFILFLIYPFILARRIRNEEIFLSEQLEGYDDYKKKVRYRLIPFIW